MPSPGTPPSRPPARDASDAAASEWTNIHLAIQEAFDRTTIDIGQTDAPGMDFQYTGLLESFWKRMSDSYNGVRERIDLKQKWKAMMRSHFPEYRPAGDRPRYICFRKPLAEGLFGVLLIKKVFMSGFGKCFVLEYQPDFPETGFADCSGFARNLFTIFHRSASLEEPYWAYSSSLELAELLNNCRQVLQLVLPVLEKHLISLLSPLPAAPPENIPCAGNLSALEAYERAKEFAMQYSADAVASTIHSFGWGLPSQGPGISLDGRLRPHGLWSFRFLSRGLGSVCQVAVPHTGRIRWNQSQRSLGNARPVRIGTVDSTVAMLRACELMDEPIRNGEPNYWSAALVSNFPYDEGAWRIDVQMKSLDPFVPRGFSVSVDRDTGQVVQHTPY